MEAYNIRKRMKNEELWLEGNYVFAAMTTALSNLDFSGKKRKPNSYLEKPFDIFEKTEEEKKIEAEKEREKAIAAFESMRKAWIEKNK